MTNPYQHKIFLKFRLKVIGSKKVSNSVKKKFMENYGCTYSEGRKGLDGLKRLMDKIQGKHVRIYTNPTISSTNTDVLRTLIERYVPIL